MLHKQQETYNMLVKTRRGAVIMAILFLGSVVATSALLQGNTQPLGSLYVPSLLLAGWSIYTLDAAHYGWRGALRWTGVGALYAGLMHAVQPLLLYLDTPLLYRLIRDLVAVLLILLSYWLLFRPARTAKPRSRP
jgi:hypothetical protein